MGAKPYVLLSYFASLLRVTPLRSNEAMKSNVRLRFTSSLQRSFFLVVYQLIITFSLKLLEVSTLNVVARLKRDPEPVSMMLDAFFIDNQLFHSLIWFSFVSILSSLIACSLSGSWYLLVRLDSFKSRSTRETLGY